MSCFIQSEQFLGLVWPTNLFPKAPEAGALEMGAARISGSLAICNAPPPQGPRLLGSLKKEGQCQVFLTPSSRDSRDVHRARGPTSHSQRQIRPRHAGPVGPTEGEEKP